MTDKYQFGRDYTLYIGKPGSDEALVIKDLQVTFNVEQVIDTKLEVSKATIKIYNLSEDSYSKLQIPQNFVRLLAGYKGSGMAEVLLGNTTDVKTEREGQDIVTTIFVGEAYSILHNTKVTSVFPPGSTIKDVIEGIAKKAGLNLGTLKGKGIKTPLLFGYPTSGTFKSQMDEICSAYKLVYCVKGNELSVSDEGEPLQDNEAEAFVFDSTSGLLGFPSYREFNYGTIKVESLSTDQKIKKKTEALKKQGIQFEALLNPRVKPGSLVKVLSEAGTVPKGLYMVIKVSFKGDFRGNDWKMEVLCDKTDLTAASIEKLKK